MNRACYVSMIVPGVIWAFGLSSVAGQSFGPLAVGGSSAAPVTVTLATAGRLGSISVRTLGAEKLDFTNAGGGTRTVGTVYTAGATCTVSVAFAPKYAWAPSGAVVLFSGAGATGTQLGSAPVHGVGSGQEIAFSTAPVVSVDTTTEPVSVAVDGAGELFVTDSGTGSLIEAPPAPGEPELLGTTGSLGAVLFTGLTIDAGGDLFVGDVYHARERMGGDSRRMTAGRP